MPNKDHPGKFTEAEMKKTLSDFHKLFESSPVEQQYKRTKYVLEKLKILRAEDSCTDDKFVFDTILLLENELNKCKAKIRVKEINNIWFNKKNMKNVNLKRDFISRKTEKFSEYKIKLLAYDNLTLPEIKFNKTDKLRNSLSNITKQTLEIIPVLWHGKKDVEDYNVRVDIHHFSNLVWEIMQLIFELYNKYPLYIIPMKSSSDDYIENNYIRDGLETFLYKDVPHIQNEYSELLTSLPGSNLSFPIFMHKLNKIYGQIDRVKLLLQTFAPVLLLKEIFCTLEGIDLENTKQCKIFYCSAEKTIIDLESDIDSGLFRIGIIVKSDEPPKKTLSVTNFAPD